MCAPRELDVSGGDLMRQAVFDVDAGTPDAVH